MSNDIQIEVTKLQANQSHLMTQLEKIENRVEKWHREIAASISELKEDMHKSSEEMKESIIDYVKSWYVRREEFSPYQKILWVVAGSVVLGLVGWVLSLILK